MTVLDDLLRECVRYVRAHFLPWTHDDEGLEGSDRDDEAVWSRALDTVIGPAEMWAAWYGDEVDQFVYFTSPAAHDAPRLIDRTMQAYNELIDLIDMTSETGERPEPGTPAWAAIVAVDQALKLARRAGRDPEAEDAEPLPVNDIVASYLLNMRRALVDSTFAFSAFEDDEDTR